MDYIFIIIYMYIYTRWESIYIIFMFLLHKFMLCHWQRAGFTLKISSWVLENTADELDRYNTFAVILCSHVAFHRVCKWTRAIRALMRRWASTALARMDEGNSQSRSPVARHVCLVTSWYLLHRLTFTYTSLSI